MKSVKNETQKFRKGCLVKAVPVEDPKWNPPIKGFYHLTEDEIREHKDEERRAIKAGEIDWHDCAGEPRLTPRHAWQTLNPAMIYQVLKARCRVQCGYHMQSGQVKILDTESGREVYCDRDVLVVVAE